MKALANLLSQPSLLEPSKHEHEFQELCAELEPIYGKAIWVLPTRPYATEHKIRKAHEIACRRGKTTLAYLTGIVKRL